MTLMKIDLSFTRTPSVLDYFSTNKKLLIFYSLVKTIKMITLPSIDSKNKLKNHRTRCIITFPTGLCIES